jgi:hypothetical protein
MRSLSSPASRLSALLACAAIVAPVAGCGSSQSANKGTDPAQAVPSIAPLYLGAIVRPTGSLKEHARAAGQTLTHQAEPYARLLGALQTPGSPPLNFQHDLAPWLGAQGGVFLSASGPSGQADLGALSSLLQQGILGSSAQIPFPFAAHSGAAAQQGAFVLDTTNKSAAQSFLNTQASRAGAHASSYRGVSYQVTASGVAFGLVDHFAVIGTESALHSVIDTTSGGSALAHSSSYSSLIAVAPGETLAHVYLAGGGTAARAAGAPAGATSGLLALLTGARPANVSLQPSASSIALDADTLSSPGAPAGLLSPAGEAARAVGELPGDAYLALGFGSAPSALAGYVQALRSLVNLSAGEPAPAGISVKGLLAATLAPVSALTENSAEARRAFQSWMGPGAVFASGTGLVDLKAGVVISSTNPALSRAAVSKLEAKLRASGASVQAASIPGTDAAFSATVTGLPLALYVADGRDAKGETKFVIGLGEASVTAALNPSSTLSSSGSYAASASVLGEGLQPSLIVQVPTVLGLLESAGLSEDPTISSFVPDLRAFSTVSGGSRSLGASVDRFRVVLGLRG